jgi:hypothetical protein
MANPKLIAGTAGIAVLFLLPGLQIFQVHNISAQPVDVSLTNAETGGVYGEVESVGPGTTRPTSARSDRVIHTASRK